MNKEYSSEKFSFTFIFEGNEAIYAMHPNQLAKRIVDIWERERYKAVRFGRTFTADVATHTTVYRYRQRGVEYVEFDVELDDRTIDQ